MKPPICKCLVMLMCLTQTIIAQSPSNVQPTLLNQDTIHGLQWRNIGPFRGGRSVASSGVVGRPMTYYMGSTGGGVWKTTNDGITWQNISDGYFQTGTVGAIAVSESNPNIVIVGMGEHAARGVMTSTGDGVYKSTDAGKSWTHIGLHHSYHISDVIIHPTDPDMVFVSVQGAQYGPTKERGIYRSTDGGKSWKNVLFINDITGASSLSMDMNNPDILYASMWQHQRFPWTIVSGGPDSGLYKSIDGGDTWKQLIKGVPNEFGKSGISVSRANSDRVYAVIEAQGKNAGVYRSDDAGDNWKQVNSDRINITRSWYYMEIFADPIDENRVYVMNAPAMKSIDGGKTFVRMTTPHGDNHHLWINPTDNNKMINSNDGGANISNNGGRNWSTQQNQPTAQFYRVIADNLVPYNVYGGEQDNSAIAIASRTNKRGIDWKDWYSVAGCESAFLAFDPDNPIEVYGGCYQGIIQRWTKAAQASKPIKEYPELGLSIEPKESKYRYNWNAPIISSIWDRQTIYHAGNVVFKTLDKGISWEIISPDLTRNEKEHQGPGGSPYTNEAAGGENYNTISYLAESPHHEGILWAGTDDGLVHITKDGGNHWTDITPLNLHRGIINSIELSTHDPATAYIAVMQYKSKDLKPYIYKTSDYGQSWQVIVNGIDRPHTFVRVVREDRKVKGLLYAGTETGMYISQDDGAHWHPFQLNLPVVPINDITIQDNDLIVATAGRSFWILDDLSSIQQSADVNTNVHLFKPKDTYRLFGGSSKNTAIGTNPKQGIYIDYYLNNITDSSQLTLHILKGEHVIKSYTNKIDKNMKTWIGGPAKPKTLSSKNGYNRFTWDLSKTAIPGVEKVFLYGSHSGAHVAPGNYTLRLTMDSTHVSETEVSILPNPAIDATPQDFQEQQEALDLIAATISDIHNSVNKMRSAKNQLHSYTTLLSEHTGVDSLIFLGKNIKQKIEDWENRLIQPKQKTFQDVINFNNQLNAKLSHLKGYIDVEDPRLTMGAKALLQDLVEQWQQQKIELDHLINGDIKAFNDLYKNTHLPAILLKK